MSAATSIRKPVPFGAFKTKRVAPVRALIYGEGGKGKSTFGSHAPSPIFVAPEDGLVNIEAEALPAPATWSTLMASLDSLATEDHPWKTVVVDSLDWAEPLCWEHVCQKAKKPDIEAFGYGKGYIAAVDEWRLFLSRLSAIRARGMNVVLVAHAVIKTFKNPEGDDYDRWMPKLHEKTTGLIVEWCDAVMFACDETFTVEKGSRSRGISSGRRILKTVGAAGLLAKNRYGLPASLPLDWHAFAEAVKAGSVPLEEQLNEMLRELGNPDVEKGCRTFVAGGGSVQEAMQTVRGYLNEKKERAHV